MKGYVWSVVNVMTGDRFFFYEHGSRSTRVAMGLLKDFAGSRNTNRQGKTTQTFFPQTGAPCPQSNSNEYHTPKKKTATGITLMQVAAKLYRRTYFLECLHYYAPTSKRRVAKSHLLATRPRGYIQVDYLITTSLTSQVGAAVFEPTYLKANWNFVPR